MKQQILLVEDNEHNLYLLTYLLEHAGFEVSQARDGRTAIAWATAHEAPALVILDIELPEMDGYDVARTLRSMPRFEALPIVAVTSHAMVGDRERALLAGCTGYLEKPIDPETFVLRIREALDPAKRRGGSR